MPVLQYKNRYWDIYLKRYWKINLAFTKKKNISAFNISFKIQEVIDILITILI